MRTKVLTEDAERTFAVIFESGDEVLSGLTRFAEEQQLAASRFTAIGAFSEVVLGYFDWEKKDYERIPVNEQVEVLQRAHIAHDQPGVVARRIELTLHGNRVMSRVARLQRACRHLSFPLIGGAKCLRLPSPLQTGPSSERERRKTQDLREE